jgi:cyclophilin family peptidyl-prolyl cis-trans isomerase
MKISHAALALVISVAFMGAGCNQVQEFNYDNNDSKPESDNAMMEADTPSDNDTMTETTMPEGLSMVRTETNSDSKVGPIALMKTNKGDIKIQLFEEATPNTVKNFVTLAEADFYDGVIFHRIIKGFMLQGGDPLTKSDRDNVRLHGTGGPGYAFGDEINLHSNAPGTLSMANSGPNTNGSQFFVNTADNNFLDGRHAVFGEVIEGMDIVTAIEAVATGANDHPVDDVEILDVEILTKG